ncbi:hypothetical protein [Dictyobacter kobayashii]|uniref:Uncharacterized protein n=1 Tax=Dictyobacter kobayashii TaxID=2014872 RepID=A0A402AX59_9CHLR|nr:hypothetical protein [Dictyobacter kobayashii]GCE23686.1 hypothetical protein KDK_74860 [Dictyobacter kobayashii]
MTTLTKRENTVDDHDSIPFSVQLSEQWLLERTYHAQLLNGKKLSIANLTEAMQQLIDIDIPLSSQSWKSLLPEKLPLKKSSNFCVPISTWQEITQEEAKAAYQQGKPVLLYGEHTWEHLQETPGIWRPNKNMRTIIYGNTPYPPEANSRTECAVCYLNVRQGIFSNETWKTWFPTDTTVLFNHHDQPITFFRPYVQFPFTTHYTIVDATGSVTEYPDREEALNGFVSTPLQEIKHGNTVQIVAPNFCYYHEVLCPSGTYRLEFFGPRMDEQGYKIKEQTPALG